MHKFEIKGNSIKYFEKERNGDHFKIKDLQNENILIAIVADGVSQQPCDWYASELACDKFINFFEANTEFELVTRTKDSIIKTNQILCEVEGDCENLHTTVSLMVWDYNNNVCLISNIGDSRIYKANNKELDQLTIDDSISKTKEIVTSIGRRTITVSSLTNVIGMSNPKVNIKTIEFKSGEVIILASDGYYDARKSSFKNDMLELGNLDSIETSFTEYFSKYELSAKDDMTAIIVLNKGL